LVGSRSVLSNNMVSSIFQSPIMFPEVPSVADAGQNNTFETQSSSSHGSRKADAASPEVRRNSRHFFSYNSISLLHI